MVKFSDEVHQASHELWQKSFNHPFIKEMVTGKLPTVKFRFYVIQDYQYLAVFGELHLQLAKELNPADGKIVKEYTDDLNAAELHERNHMFKELSVTQKEWQQEAAPANYNYMNHMRHSMALSPAIGLASFIPCPWLYVELAQHWQDSTSPVPIYADFFHMYQQAAKDQSAVPMIKLMDKLAEQAAPEERQQMAQAFKRSSYYELQFWQMAYEDQRWA